MNSIPLPSIVEALIFAADVPLSKGRIMSMVESLQSEDVVRIVEELNKHYELSRRPVRIVEMGGGYQMVTREEFAPWIARLFSSRRKVRLSQAALETIAIVAYRQPIARMDVERIRGVNVDGILKNLVDKNLIRIVGRDKGLGRPFLYGTTSEFLSHFGLKKLSDLPDYENVRKGITPLEMEGGGLMGSLEDQLESGDDDPTESFEDGTEPENRGQAGSFEGEPELADIDLMDTPEEPSEIREDNGSS